MIKKKQKKELNKIIDNKKVYHHFHIKQTIEAGIVLKGWEVKAIRKKQLNIEGSYVNFKSDSAFVIGTTIQPLLNIFKENNIYLKKCDRKLLLHKKEINFLSKKVKKEGYTVVIIYWFWNKQNLCKLKLGLAKGKNKQDKREQEKKYTWKKEQNSVLKRIKNLS